MRSKQNSRSIPSFMNPQKKSYQKNGKLLAEQAKPSLFRLSLTDSTVLVPVNSFSSTEAAGRKC